MKDLDFDELDRAVNSLMTNVPKTSEPDKKDDSVHTLTITPTINQNVPPSFNTLDSTLNQINKTDSPASTTTTTPIEQDASDKMSSPAVTNSPRTAQPAPLAARRGRFMDVVRPASGVKKPDAQVSMSRLGMTITPSGSSMKDVVSPVQATPPPTIVPPVTRTSSSVDPSDWPDPLDMVKKTDMPELLEESKDTQSEELLPASTADTPKGVAEDMPAPLTSPFLADAKVEKRPLGMASTDDVTREEKEETHKDSEDDSVGDQTNPANTSHPALPEELSTDMTALEAGADTVGASSTHTQNTSPSVLMSETPKVAVKDTTGTSALIVTPSTLTTPEPDTKPVATAPISIPQQYHEEPSTGEKENGSIYDTDTYHTPLTHPAKKGSGWMWVLWIVVILLLGAGGGAVLYFLHIF